MSSRTVSIKQTVVGKLYNVPSKHKQMNLLIGMLTTADIDTEYGSIWVTIHIGVKNLNSNRPNISNWTLTFEDGCGSFSKDNW